MFCPHCGKEIVPQPGCCSYCGGGVYATAAGPTRIVRPRSPRMIAGVCSGIAIHFGWDIVMVRMIFAAICLVTGAAALFYIAAWIIIPQAPYAVPMSPVDSGYVTTA